MCASAGIGLSERLTKPNNSVLCCIDFSRLVRELSKGGTVRLKLSDLPTKDELATIRDDERDEEDAPLLINNI